jgi:diguanylate cyclase (GGDEF)-like protein
MQADSALMPLHAPARSGGRGTSVGARAVLNSRFAALFLGSRFRGDEAGDAGAGTRRGLALTLREQAAAQLDRGLPGNLIASVVIGVAMAVAIDLSNPTRFPMTWLGLLLLLTSVRVGYFLYRRGQRPSDDSLAQLSHHLLGLLANALVWAAMPWWSFAELDSAGRVTAMLATAGLASLDTRLLAAMPRVAIGLCGLLLLPGAIWMFGSGEHADTVVGLMIGALFVMVAVAIHRGARTHRTACELLHENKRLIALEAETRRQVDQLQNESAESKAVMARAHVGLEQRIDERTAALEDRSRDLARQAITDALTGLPNRKGINEHLSELLAPMSDPSHTGELALLFLDLDHFKEVNDQFGHLSGDSVLRQVAERLRENLPRSAFSARWGGDEFIVVLPGMGRRVEQVRLVAEQLRAALCMPMRLEGGVVRVGCSIGIALAPSHGRTPETLIIAADHAVYAAKSEGILRVRLFDVALAKKAGRQSQIAQALPAALELGQLEIAYQPIVSALTGEASHVEALARWTHPKWGAVSPAEFIPVAEASGHIHTMGRWVLRQACLDAARWTGDHPPKVSVNVSAMQVTSGRLVAQVREALAASKLPAQRLVIELTESMPMAGSDTVAATLAELRSMGVALALDDFGTGYSSLSSLLKQPLSLVKVDRSFVMDVPGDGEILIKATVDVARCFGLEVVAEGVENRSQQARLTALGVNYMQGYLFGRPMPNVEFLAWMALRDGSVERIALRA